MNAIRLRHAIRRVPRLLTLNSRRFFAHTTSRQNQDVQDSSYSPKITRKKYSELPKQRLLADGKPAVPMAAWEGGLHDSPAASELDSAVNSTRRIPMVPG
jgi:hypothetical protein